MTALELRTEIHKAIDSLPESVLPKLLNHLNGINKLATEKDSIDQFIEKIMKEDYNLLKRLSK
jgi:hypothetical protein